MDRSSFVVVQVLRSEVLRLVAKRDRKLGEEFLKALDEAAEKARAEAAADQRRTFRALALAHRNVCNWRAGLSRMVR